MGYANKKDRIAQRGMEVNNYMYLPALSEDEFVENIDKDDFFRRFGNPAVIHTKTGERCIVLSAELYDQMAELCGHPSTKELIKAKSEKTDGKCSGT